MWNLGPHEPLTLAGRDKFDSCNPHKQKEFLLLFLQILEASANL